MSEEKTKTAGATKANKAFEDSKNALLKDLLEKGLGSIKVFFLVQAIEKNLKGDLAPLAKEFNDTVMSVAGPMSKIDPNYRVVINRKAIPLIETL